MNSLLLQKNILESKQCFDQSLGDTIVFNTESALCYLKISAYRQYCDFAPNIAVDGAFLALALRLRGFHVKRYHGPDLMKDIMCNNTSYCILVGGTAQNEILVNQGLIQKFICLAYFEEIENLLQDFKNKYVPTEKQNLVFFISLGLPKQEKFAHRLRNLLETHFDLDPNDFRIVAIGAAADFHNGTKKRAGKFWRKLGLEWLPRLIREPRMWSRNIRSFAAFVLVVLGK